VLPSLFFSWHHFFPAPAKNTNGASYLLILEVMLTSLIYVLRLFSTRGPIAVFIVPPLFP